MNYTDIRKGRFISRPNRFIAEVEIDGEKEICHVKNTGRCKELLLKGSAVVCEKSPNPARKTRYDLVAVYKGDRLINMDSQAPNRAVLEAIPALFSGVTLIKPEYSYKSSRIDFYIEASGEKILLEVKGVTLEENNTALFPDAPTERGVKHINELISALSEGYRACILFLVQMSGADCFRPNRKTHPEFAEALKKAEREGVEILAYDTEVTESSMTVGRRIRTEI
ncbi:DNA/RNA nuclease SfsA [Ruminococcus sp. Marseille-P6503]|uniref:DNA/RNA nuclease SfsA n=1 Tax=Ruminococcus sp. Marseille-P6503 TaxID=2364796 RepID=UPI000F541324|nr:DNA/RNA nuclease SfsA [Ruminococcus sp. Marseille-P6503]